MNYIWCRTHKKLTVAANNNGTRIGCRTVWREKMNAALTTTALEHWMQLEMKNFIVENGKWNLTFVFSFFLSFFRLYNDCTYTNKNVSACVHSRHLNQSSKLQRHKYYKSMKNIWKKKEKKQCYAIEVLNGIRWNSWIQSLFRQWHVVVYNSQAECIEINVQTNTLLAYESKRGRQRDQEQTHMHTHTPIHFYLSS